MYIINHVNFWLPSPRGGTKKFGIKCAFLLTQTVVGRNCISAPNIEFFFPTGGKLVYRIVILPQNIFFLTHTSGWMEKNILVDRNMCKIRGKMEKLGNPGMIIIQLNLIIFLLHPQGAPIVSMRWDLWGGGGVIISACYYHNYFLKWCVHNLYFTFQYVAI